MDLPVPSLQTVFQLPMRTKAWLKLLKEQKRHDAFSERERTFHSPLLIYYYRLPSE
jgi:hypothetical protein